MKVQVWALLFLALIYQEGFAYKLEDVDDLDLSSINKEKTTTNAFGKELKDAELKDKDDLRNRPEEDEENDAGNRWDENDAEEEDEEKEEEDESDNINKDFMNHDENELKSKDFEVQGGNDLNDDDSEDENELRNKDAGTNEFDETDSPQEETSVLTRNETELPLDDDDEEIIEVTRETYDPKEFEDEEGEFRTDWMQPETTSSDEFIDETEFADMPSREQEQKEFENFDDDPLTQEDLDLNEEQLNNLEDEDVDEILKSKEIRALAKKDPLVFRGLVRKVSRGARRVARHVSRGVKRTVRHVSRGVRRVVRHVSRGSRKIGRTLHGAVRSVGRSEIGRFFGKVAKKAFDFFKCAIPGLENIDHCVKDAIRSVGSCKRGSSSCRMKIGGKRSKCLRFSLTKSYRKSYGPTTFSGYVKPSIGIGVEAYLNTGKIAISLDGSVKINSKLQIKVQRLNKKTYQKRIPLTKHPKRIFKKLIVVLVGKVPVPVLIEVTVQPVARLKLTASASGSFKASITLKKDARIALDNARVEYEPGKGLPKFSLRASNNLNNLQIQKVALLQGSATLTGSLSIGVEIVVSVNGVPIKMFPAIQFKLTGTLSGTTHNGGCVKGSLSLSTNLKMLVIPDIRRMTSASANFKKACGHMTDFACLNPAIRTLGCFHKSFNPCKTMKDGCNEFGKALEFIPNPIQKNPTLAEFSLFKGSFSLWSTSRCSILALGHILPLTPLYRYWNPRIVDHFYTTNYNELRAGGKHGWKYEGVQCKLLRNRMPGSVPLYRYYRPGDHFYTTNIHEIGTSSPGAMGKHGYRSEGISGYCYPTHRLGTIPLYRYWKANRSDHFYTTSIHEIGTAINGRVGRHGYKSEGIACYVYKK